MDRLIADHALAETLIMATHNTRRLENVPGLKLQDWQQLNRSVGSAAAAGSRRFMPNQPAAPAE